MNSPLADRGSNTVPEDAEPARGRTEGPAPGFGSPPLGDMVAVGAVKAHTARIWLRAERAGRVRVDYWPSSSPDAVGRAETWIDAESETDRTACLGLPSSGDARLLAGTPYSFRAVYSDGAPLGEGRFETAPADSNAAPERFAIALMSCHMPFDDDGNAVKAAVDMLRAVRKCLDAHATKVVLTIGDQMYTDYPRGLDIFDAEYFSRISPGPGCERVTQCSAAQVRELLHARYRHFWNVEGWRELHGNFACYPIIDDHELVDNWGAVPAHAGAEWRPFFEGARAAYRDYQDSRVRDGAGGQRDFDYELEYGPVAIYVLDLRSNRHVGDEPRMYSDEQFRNLCGFLERQADKQIVQIVFSVPAIHLPKWGARLGRVLTHVPNEDFSDRWSTAGHVVDRDRVLRRLHEHQRAHPHQRLALLSGDIHIACAHEISWDDGTKPLLQLVSSGITNRVGCLVQGASKLSILANRRLALEGGALSAAVRTLRGVGPRRNPYTKLNLGLIDFQRDETGRYNVRYLIYGNRRGEPVCAYRSPWR